MGYCQKMKVSFITTCNHNVGDDFVREGILYLIEKKLRPVRYSLVHKHIPLTARPNWEWVYNIGLTRSLDKLPKCRGYFWSKIIDSLPLNKKNDKILNCDLLVQSGTPMYWKGAQNNEWFTPLIKRRYLSVKEKVPFINIGAGTCLPYASDGSELFNDISFVDYIKEVHSLCTVTTVRDTLSKIILNKTNLDAVVIPCPSLFARKYYEIPSRNVEYIALNYMPHGGHYLFGQSINSRQWEINFKKLYVTLAAKFPVVLFCHDLKEYAVAGRILPEAKRFYATSAKEYLDAYARAKYFIGNRVHGAFVVASFGRPAFVVGNDTRALMMKEIGLKCLFINDANMDILMDVISELEMRQASYRDEFEIIKRQASLDYSKALELITLC